MNGESGLPANRHGLADAPARSTNGVCAVVVTYFPAAGLEELLCTIIPQVETLVVVDNTPNGDQLPKFAILAQHAGHVRIVENRANLGIGAALNRGLEQARQSGCRWLLTLDQDTRCYPDMVETLLRLDEACTPRPAVIGANYFDAQNGRNKVPTEGEGECLEQKTVITSGSLVDVGLAHAAGGFRADYFIDQVDHEFCLRMRAHGHRVVISRKPAMAHSVGEKGGVWLPLLGTLPNHPPLRKYYIARNTVVTVADYWRREPDWCLRRMARLLLGLFLMATLERQRIAKVRAFVAGFMDGLRRRMGPCPRDWLRPVQ